MQVFRWSALWIGMACLVSCGPAGPDVYVEDPWSFPLPGQHEIQGANIAVYAAIRNRGGADDQLIWAHTPVADTVEIHQSTIDEKGVMRMRPQARVSIPARSDMLFEPGGHHFMLVNINRPLELGDSFQMRLEFAKTGEYHVTVVVRNP